MKARVIDYNRKFRIGDKVRTLLPCSIHNTDVTYPTGTTGIITEICDYPNYTVYLVYLDEYFGAARYMVDDLELISDFEEDDRPQCCKDHGVYGATCDTCDYGDGPEEESEDNKLCTYEEVQRNVTVEEVERLEEELRCARSEVADLKNLIIKLLFDRYGF